MYGSGFGARTTPSFGQSTFGKPTTTFGSNTSAFGSGTTSLFGQTTQPSTGLFGSQPATSSVFGQSAPATGGFGTFGSTATGTSLFGSSQPTTGLFGSTLTNATPNATSGGLFGSTPAGTSAFGQASTSTGAGFGFGGGTSTGLFGQTQPVAQSTSLFGQSSGGGLFGSSTSAFGSTASGTTIKFNPVTGTDTLVKNGVSTSISTKHNCITCMKEYEAKSLEELRCEDYLANRKGPQQVTTQPALGLFGSTSSTPGLFGSTATTTTASSIFGFGQQQTTPLFGQSTGTSLFGKPATTTPFGATATTQANTSFTGFGQNTTNLFGSTAAKPAFGSATPQTNLFGSTTSTSAAPAFGTQTPAFGFGAQQPAQGGLFSQNKFGFGTQTTTNTFGMGTNTASTSLFGQKPATPAFGLPTASAAPTFGTGTFGQTSQPSLFGGNTAFGAKPQTGFSFGQTSTATSSTAPLFGSTAAKPGGLFGGTSATPGNLFGSGTFGSSSLSTPAFGTQNTSNLNTMNTGLFGAATQPQVTTGSSNSERELIALRALPYGNISLFKCSVNSQSPTKAKELLKNSSEIISEKANSNPMGYKVSLVQGNNLVKRRPLGITNETKKSLFEGLDSGDSETTEFTKSLGSPRYLHLKTNDSPRASHKPSNIISNEKSLLDIIRAKSPPKSEITTLRGMIPTSPKGRKSIIKASMLEDDKTMAELKEPLTNSTTTPKKATSTPAPKETSSTVAPKEMTFTITPKRTSSTPAIKKHTVTFAADVKYSQDDEGPSKKQVQMDSKSPPKSSPKSPLSYSDISSIEPVAQEEAIPAFAQKAEPHPTGIILTRPDYYTIPSLDDIAKLMDENGRCLVANFTIGRYKFGNVTFLESFDVSGLDIDSIVIFRHKEIDVYPDEKAKPPVGEGLNRRAQITLDRVWPVDKTTRQLISDPPRLEQMNYVTKLRRASARMNANFVEYRPITGSWVFEVAHFSKYGLSDSEDEAEGETNYRRIERKKLKSIVPPKASKESALTDSEKKKLSDAVSVTVAKRGLDGGFIREASSPVAYKTPKALFDEDDAMVDYEDMEHSIEDEDDAFSAYKMGDEISLINSTTRSQPALRRMQMMKASLYVDDQTEDEYLNNSARRVSRLTGTTRRSKRGNEISQRRNVENPKDYSSMSNFAMAGERSFSKLYDQIQQSVVMDEDRTNLLDEIYDSYAIYEPASITIVKMNRMVSKYRNGVVPYAKSFASAMGKATGQNCDVGLKMDKSFRVSWGKGLTLMALMSEKSEEGKYHSEVSRLACLFRGRDINNDFSANVIRKLKLSSTFDSNFKELIDRHLNICLSESECELSVECPLFIPKEGREALHKHCDFVQEVRNATDYVRQTWQLMRALWGHVTDFFPSDNKHKENMLRKEALTVWLEETVSHSAQSEIVDTDHISSILSLLSAHKILEACDLAIKGGDFNLALLISQIEGGDAVRMQMEKQLAQWRETEADKLIDRGRLKIMTLIAGHIMYASNQGVVNVCRNLDWKRAFGVHLWYVTRPNESIMDAVAEYESAFQEADDGALFVESPNPPYASTFSEYESNAGVKVQDVRFHLLKLFCCPSYSLATVLNPINHTSNALDYQLSWLMMTILESIGYHHLSEDCATQICVNFAAQLESYDLWQWAVFVLLHIKDTHGRAKKVMDIIERNVKLADDKAISLTEEELFVIEKLNVPKDWVFDAKATLALYKQRYVEAAWFYVKAERWNEAHQIIMTHLYPHAIINDRYHHIRQLLRELVLSGKVFGGWNHGGSLVWDYLCLMEEVRDLSLSQEEDVVPRLEKIQQSLNLLCNKLQFLPAHTAKEKLCQAEISKRIVNFVKTLLTIRCDKSVLSIKLLTQVVTYLPLPENVQQRELSTIIGMWIAK